MITRVWHGKTKSIDADKYLRFLIDYGVTEYQNTPGNLEVRIWRRIDRNEAHFLDNFNLGVYRIH